MSIALVTKAVTGVTIDGRVLDRIKWRMDEIRPIQ
jgi:hypothetical protein